MPGPRALQGPSPPQPAALQQSACMALAFLFLMHRRQVGAQPALPHCLTLRRLPGHSQTQTQPSPRLTESHLKFLLAPQWLSGLGCVETTPERPLQWPWFKASKGSQGKSLVVQLSHSQLLRARVQSLVRELKSHKPCSVGKKKFFKQK